MLGAVVELVVEPAWGEMVSVTIFKVSTSTSSSPPMVISSVSPWSYSGSGNLVLPRPSLSGCGSLHTWKCGLLVGRSGDHDAAEVREQETVEGAVLVEERREEEGDEEGAVEEEDRVGVECGECSRALAEAGEDVIFARTAAVVGSEGGTDTPGRSRCIGEGSPCMP